MQSNLLSFITLCCCMCSVSTPTFAYQSYNYDLKPGTYYGTKVGKTPFNPCSGKCTRICADIKFVSPAVDTIKVDGKKSLPITFSSQMTKDATPIMLWRVPKDFPEEEFQKIKTKESLYSNLRVVRGLEDEDSK